MKQERKFSLAEVHTKMGTMGEVRLNQTFLDVLGVKPGDFLVFTVSKEGGVTVAGEKQTTHRPSGSNGTFFYAKRNCRCKLEKQRFCFLSLLYLLSSNLAEMV